MKRRVESCPYRKPLPHSESIRGRDAAMCGLLDQITEVPAAELLNVEHSVCEACCQSFPSTMDDWNPVVASLVHRVGEQILSTVGESTSEAARARTMCEKAIAQIPIVFGEEDDCVDDIQTASTAFSVTQKELEAFLPLPTITRPDTLQSCDIERASTIRWAVGVTTAPRRQPTLSICLTSVAQSGWSTPFLFLDGEVDVDQQHRSLIRSSRSESLGAWPAWCETMRTLLNDDCDCDAVMIVQDDSLFAPTSSIRPYVESLLWPGNSSAILSLYTSAEDMQAGNLWRPYVGRWQYGALALVFPREVAIDLLSSADRGELDVVRGTAGIDSRIGYWAEQTGVPIWHPSPSLVQHIGQVSSVWEHSRAVGLRRADRFIANELSRRF